MKVDKPTGPESFVRIYGRKRRAYFRCPVTGCGVTIRKDGRESGRRIRDHRESHGARRS